MASWPNGTMGRRPMVLAIATAVLAVAAIALIVSMQGDYRAPVVQSPRPRGAPVVASGVVAADAAPANVVDGAVEAQPVDAPQAPIDDTAPARRAEREALLAKVRNSGSGHEGWDDQASEIFTTAVGDSGTVVESECFIAGCAATLSFPSRAAYEHEIDSLEESRQYRAWTGGKVLTLPELRRDGSEVLALVLYRPD